MIRNSCLIFFCSGLCNFSSSGVSNLKQNCQICCIATLQLIVTGDAIPTGLKTNATRLKSFLWVYNVAFLWKLLQLLCRSLSSRNYHFCRNMPVNSFGSSNSSHGIRSSSSGKFNKFLVNLKPPRCEHSLT